MTYCALGIPNTLFDAKIQNSRPRENALLALIKQHSKWGWFKAFGILRIITILLNKQALRASFFLEVPTRFFGVLACPGIADVMFPYYNFKIPATSNIYDELWNS